MAIRIFQHYWQLPLAVLACVESLLFVVTPFLASLTLGEHDVFPAHDLFGVLLPRGMLFAFVMFVSMAAMGLYNSRQRSRLAGMVSRVAASVGAASLVLVVVFFLFPVLHMGRSWFLLAVLYAFALSVVVRVVFDTVVDEEIFKRRILVYGAGRRAGSIARLRRRSDRRGFTVVGYVAADGDEIAVTEAELIKHQINLAEMCEKQGVDEIVVAMDDRRRQFPMEQLLEARLDGVEIVELVTFLERETGKVRLDVLNPSWMIFSDGFRQGRLHSALERAFDILASLLLLIVAAPIMALTVIAIKVSEGISAPVLYRQMRVGQYGRSFPLLKFRSMRQDAEVDGKPQWAKKNDSRVTRVGSFIRLTRIDELPQMLCVLRGDMSFVGPRPERPEFVDQLNERIPYYRERHSIKPGITGWAQLCYPYGSSEQDALEKLQYDLFYVKNHSLLFYIAILVQTVEVIVWGKGAR